MRGKRNFILFIVLLILQPALAQELLLRRYTTKDGLTSNTVYNVLEDKHGLLWFCTDQGVCQFDGHQFRSYTTSDGLPDNEVFDIKEDNAGRLWFSGYNARISYALNGKIYNASNDSYCKRIEHDAVLNKLRLDVGKTPSSVLLKGLDHPELRLYAYATYNIMESQFLHHINGESYFLVHNYLVKADAYGISAFGVKRAGYAFYHGRYVYASGLDTSGHIYFCKIALNGPDGDCVESSISMPVFIYGGIMLDDTTILLASDNGALAFIDNRNYIDTNRTLLRNIPVSSLHRDRRGNLWFTTLSEGAYMLPETRPAIFKKNVKIPEAGIEAICITSSGTIVAGYANGTIKTIRNGVVSTIVLPGFTSHDRVLKIAQSDDGRILIGTDKGLFTGDTAGWRIKAAEGFMATGSVKETISVGDGFLIGGMGGAVKSNTNGNITDVLWARRTTAIAYDNGTYWLGTPEGVYTYANGRVNQFGSTTQLGHSRITVIRKTCGNDIAFGTHQNGLFIWDRKKLWHIAEQDGLSSNICRKIVVDKRCDIWVATNRGLDIISKNKDSRGYYVKHVPLSDGIPANEIHDFAIHNDKLYIACPEGIIKLDIEKQLHSWRIKPLITSVISRDTNFTGMDHLDLQHDQNDLTIHYTGIALGDGERPLYKYVLEGKRSDTIVTRLNYVNLDAISSGEYRFLVWAKSSNGDWSRAPAILSFTIHPPFWQTFWFITLVTIFAAGIIYTLVRRRIINIKRAEQHKTALNKRMAALEMQALRAQINPHFVFNALNSIQHYYYQNDERKANRYMTTFARLIRKTLTHSKENWLTLAEECNMIQDYINLEQMRFRNTFQYEIRVSDNILPEQVKVPAMIIQPYVENAISHGLRHLQNTTGYLLIGFSITGTQLICTIDDNGVGFKQAATIEQEKKQHRSMGMEITKNRIDTINQLYNININVRVIDKATHKPGQNGTIIEISIPLTYQQHYEQEYTDHHNS